MGFLQPASGWVGLLQGVVPVLLQPLHSSCPLGASESSSGYWAPFLMEQAERTGEGAQAPGFSFRWGLWVLGPGHGAGHGRPSIFSLTATPVSAFGSRPTSPGGQGGAVLWAEACPLLL